jgi:uncharacterized protein (TIGR03067 family)
MRPYLPVLACAASLMLMPLASGEVIEMEGVIKAIDAETRSLTISRKTPKGEKLLELEVAKTAGNLSTLKVGEEIDFAYNPTVDIITRIGKESPKGTKEASAEVDTDSKAFQGKWVATALIISGKKLTKGEMQRHSRTFSFKGKKYQETMFRDGQVSSVDGTFSIDSEEKTIEIKAKYSGNGKIIDGYEMFGFYEFEDDKLRLCVRRKVDDDTPAPTEFGEADAGKAWTNSFVLERDE